MKRIFVLAFVLATLFVTVAWADQSVLVNTPASTIQVQVETGLAVVPAWGVYRYYRAVPTPIPVNPTPLVVPPPVKPIFKTPLRDGAYYGMYYQRVWRWHRLGRILNVAPQVAPAPAPTPAPVEPQPTPAPVDPQPTPAPTPGPVTPLDPR